MPGLRVPNDVASEKGRGNGERLEQHHDRRQQGREYDLCQGTRAKPPRAAERLTLPAVERQRQSHKSGEKQGGQCHAEQQIDLEIRRHGPVREQVEAGLEIFSTNNRALKGSERAKEKKRKP